MRYRHQRFRRLIVQPLERRYLMAAIVESEPNNEPAAANAISFYDRDDSLGISRAVAARGTVSHSSDIDWWSFEADAGDVIDAWAIDLMASASSRQVPDVTLMGPSGEALELPSLSNAIYQRKYAAVISGIKIPRDGEYFVRVSKAVDSGIGEYELNLRRAETEGSAAVPFEFFNDNHRDPVTSDDAFLTGARRVDGMILPQRMEYGNQRSEEVDRILIGKVRPGTEVVVTLSIPNWSTLVPEMYLRDESGFVKLDDLDSNPLVVRTEISGSIEKTIALFVHAAVPGQVTQLGEYSVDIRVVDNEAPRLDSTSLPDEGTTRQRRLEQISIVFSEAIDHSTFDSSDFELREMGPDGAFDTADDKFIELDFRHSSGPSQPSVTFVFDSYLTEGNYRFSLFPSFTDEPGNTFATGESGIPGQAFSRQFFIANLPDLTVSGTFIRSRQLIDPRSAFDLSWRVYNTGSADVGGWTERVYVAKGRDIQDRILVSEHRVESSLAAGSDRWRSERLRLPENAPDGYVSWIIDVDAEQSIDEIDEQNLQMSDGGAEIVRVIDSGDTSAPMTVIFDADEIDSLPTYFAIVGNTELDFRGHWSSVDYNFVSGIGAFHEVWAFGRRLSIHDETPWRNPVHHADVNRDGRISPLDALLVLNLIAVNPSYMDTLPPIQSLVPRQPYYDVNGDSRLSLTDAVQVMNAIARRPSGTVKNELMESLERESGLSPFDEDSFLEFASQPGSFF